MSLEPLSRGETDLYLDRKIVRMWVGKGGGGKTEQGDEARLRKCRGGRRRPLLGEQPR